MDSQSQSSISAKEEKSAASQEASQDKIEVPSQKADNSHEVENPSGNNSLHEQSQAQEEEKPKEDSVHEEASKEEQNKSQSVTEDKKEEASVNEQINNSVSEKQEEKEASQANIEASREEQASRTEEVKEEGHESVDKKDENNEQVENETSQKPEDKSKDESINQEVNAEEQNKSQSVAEDKKEEVSVNEQINNSVSEKQEEKEASQANIEASREEQASKTEEVKEENSVSVDKKDESNGQVENETSQKHEEIVSEKANESGIVPSQKEIESEKVNESGVVPSQKEVESEKANESGVVPSQKEVESEKANESVVVSSKKETESEKANESGVVPSQKEIESEKANESGVVPSQKETESEKANESGVVSSKKETESEKADESGVAPSQKETESEKANESGVASSQKEVMESSKHEKSIDVQERSSHLTESEIGFKEGASEVREIENVSIERSRIQDQSVEQAMTSEVENTQEVEEQMEEIKETDREQAPDDQEEDEENGDTQDQQESRNYRHGNQSIPEEESEDVDDTIDKKVPSEERQAGEEVPEESPGDDEDDDDDDDDEEMEEDEEKLLSELKALVKSNPIEKETSRSPGRTSARPQQGINAKNKSFSPTRRCLNFEEYYEKYCIGFLEKRNEDLSKKRQQKEADELAELKDRPTLVARPNGKKHVNLMDRTAILNARKAEEIEKMRKEKEKEMEKELAELTFHPKINERPKWLDSPRKDYNRSKVKDPLMTEDLFSPKINRNSIAIAETIKESIADDVVERLYYHYENSKLRREELIKQYTPKFTPSLNKQTRKIVQRIERNYREDDPYNNVREMSDDEEIYGSPTGKGKDGHDNNQSSDLELLAILKQFNQMLKQKNEGPISLQQLNTLMARTAEKRKGDKVDSSARGAGDDGAYSHRRYETEPSRRSNRDEIYRIENQSGIDGDSTNRRSGDLMSNLIHKPKGVKSSKNLQDSGKKSSASGKKNKISAVGGEKKKSTSPGKTGKKTKSKSKSKIDQDERLEKATQTSKKGKKNPGSGVGSQIVGSKNALEGWPANHPENRGSEDEIFDKNREERLNAVGSSKKSLDSKVSKSKETGKSKTINSKQESFDRSQGYATEEEARKQSRERQLGSQKNVDGSFRGEREGLTSGAGSRRDSDFNESQRDKMLSEKVKSKASVNNSDVSGSQKGKTGSEGSYAAKKKQKDNTINSVKSKTGSEKGSKSQLEDEEPQSKSGSKNYSKSQREGAPKGKSSFYSHKDMSSIRNEKQIGSMSSAARPRDESGASEAEEGSLSLHHSERNGNDNMSFSAKNRDFKGSGSEQGGFTTDQKLLDELDSQTSKDFNVKTIESDRPRKTRRADPSTFSIVTTEMIQIHPTSNRFGQGYTFSMGGVDQTFKAAPASSSGLKAMAEQIVRKFKAYDAQLKNSTQEFKISISPPRSLSPADAVVDEVNNSRRQAPPPQNELPKKHLFKSVKGSEIGSSRKDSMASQKQKPSLQGSLNSIQSGSYAMKRNEMSHRSSQPGSVKSGKAI